MKIRTRRVSKQKLEHRRVGASLSTSLWLWTTKNGMHNLRWACKDQIVLIITTDVNFAWKPLKMCTRRFSKQELERTRVRASLPRNSFVWNTENRKHNLGFVYDGSMVLRDPANFIFPWKPLQVCKCRILKHSKQRREVLASLTRKDCVPIANVYIPPYFD